MRQVFKNEKVQMFMQKIGKPLFTFGQKLASETIPNFGAKFMPAKLSKSLANIGSTAVGASAAAAGGFIALQTPITLLTLLAIGSVTAWPVIAITTLAIGAGATAATFIGAGMAYSGAKGLSQTFKSEKMEKASITGAAGVGFNGVGAAPATQFDPEKDFVGAAPTNDNKRFVVVNAAPEGKTAFGQGLDAKNGFNNAHNGTAKPAQEQAATPAAKVAVNAPKNQPTPKATK